MAELIVQVDDDRAHDGPCMSCLGKQERDFVVAMVVTGAGANSVGQAAAAAGYLNPSTYGWQLMRKPKILAAVREEAGKRLLSGALIGAKVLMDIAMDAGHKDQFKAAKELLAHNGFNPVIEQKITVEHTTKDQADMIAEIKLFAKQLGLDPQRLLGSAGVTVDAEFTPVDPAVEEWTV